MEGTDPKPAPICATCGEQAKADADANEEVTHCEWCGAEYPVPED